MAVKRKNNTGEVFYHCREHLSNGKENPCPYNRFNTAKWDSDIWNEVCQRLRNDLWVDKQLDSEFDRNNAINKLIV